MPEHMEMTRDELVKFLKRSIREGCVGRIRAVLAARGQDLQQAESRVPKFTIVLSGFEQVIGESGEALVRASGEVRVLFGNSKEGVRLEDLDLEFRPFTILVKDGYYLGVNNQPMLFEVVETLAHLPTEEAEVDSKIITIRFRRSLTGWEGFFLCLCLNPDRPDQLVAGDLTEIRVVWD
jgi:hypothetical protein